MIKRVNGIVRGNTIVVSELLGLQDGREVNVIIETENQVPLAWGDGLQRCAGRLSDSWSEHDDQILNQIHSERHQDSRMELR